MPEELKGWKCDKCGSVLDTEELAVKCEETHKCNPEITYMGNFSKLPKYLCLNSLPPHVPQRIRVEFSKDKSCDSASYVLEHYGAKGV